MNYFSVFICFFLLVEYFHAASFTRFEWIEEPNEGEQRIVDNNDDPGPTTLKSFLFTVSPTNADVTYYNQWDTGAIASHTVAIADVDEGINTLELQLFEGITYIYVFARNPVGSTDDWVLGPLTIDGAIPMAFIVDQGPPRAPEIGGFYIEGARTANLQNPDIKAHYVNFSPINTAFLAEIIFNNYDVQLTSSLEVSFIGTVTNDTQLFDTDPDNEPNPNPFPGAVNRRAECLADVAAQLARILGAVPSTGPPLSAEYLSDVTTKTGPFPLVISDIDYSGPNITNARKGPAPGLFNAIGFDFHNLADGNYEITVGARDGFENKSPGGFQAFGNLSSPVAGTPPRILIKKDTVPPRTILLEKPTSVFIFGNNPPSVDPPFEDSFFVLKGTVNDERQETSMVRIFSQDSPDRDGVLESANGIIPGFFVMTDPKTGLLEMNMDASAWNPQAPNQSQTAYRFGFVPLDLSGNVNNSNEVELLMIKDTYPPRTPIFTNVKDGDFIKTTFFKIAGKADNEFTTVNAEHGRVQFELYIYLETSIGSQLIQSFTIPMSGSSTAPATNSLLDDAFLTFQREIKILDPKGVETGHVSTVTFNPSTHVFDHLVYKDFLMEKIVNFTSIPDGFLRFDLCLLDQVGNKSNPCTSVNVAKDTSGPRLGLDLLESGPDDNYTSFPDLPNYYGADDLNFVVSLISPEFTIDDGTPPQATRPDPHFRMQNIPSPQNIGLFLKGRATENFGETTRIDVSGSRIPAFSLFSSAIFPAGTDLSLDYQGMTTVVHQPPLINTPQKTADFEIRIPLFNFLEGAPDVIRLQGVDSRGNRGPEVTFFVSRDVKPPSKPVIEFPLTPPGFSVPVIYTNSDTIKISGVTEPDARVVVLLPPAGSSAGFDLNSSMRIPRTSPGSIPIAGSDYDSLAITCASVVCLEVDADKEGKFQLSGVDITTVATSLSVPTTIWVQAIDSYQNTDPVSSARSIEIHRNTLNVPVDRVYLLDEPSLGEKFLIYPPSQSPSEARTVFYSMERVRLEIETLFPMSLAPDLQIQENGYVWKDAGKVASSFPYQIGTFSFQYSFEVHPEKKIYDGISQAKISGGRNLFGNAVATTIVTEAFVVDTVAPNEFTTEPRIALFPIDSMLVTTFTSTLIELNDFYKDTTSVDLASGVQTSALEIRMFGPLQLTPDSLFEIPLQTFVPFAGDFDLGARLQSPLVTDGSYRLEFNAIDRVGNKKKFYRTFILDRQAIVEPLLVTVPANRSIISTFPFSDRHQTHVQLKIFDIEADLQRSDFSLISPHIGMVSSTKTTSQSENSIFRTMDLGTVPPMDGSSDGIYLLDLDVFDRTGNQTKKVHSFLYDTLSPVVRRVYPQDVSCVRELKEISYFVSEDLSTTLSVSGVDRQKSKVTVSLFEAFKPENSHSSGYILPSTFSWLSQDPDLFSTQIVSMKPQLTPTEFADGRFDGVYQIKASFFDFASNFRESVTSFCLDSLPPSLHLSGVLDDQVIAAQRFRFEGFWMDRGICWEKNPLQNPVLPQYLAVNVYGLDLQSGKTLSLLTGPLYPDIFEAPQVLDSFQSVMRHFVISSSFFTQEPVRFEFIASDSAGNIYRDYRDMGVKDSRPWFPQPISPLSVFEYKGVTLSSWTSSAVLNLSWKPTDHAGFYRLHLSRESLTPLQRTTMIRLPASIQTYAVDYSLLTSNATISQLPLTDTFYWLVETEDAAGNLSDPTGSMGLGQRIFYDRQPSEGRADQLRMLLPEGEFLLDSLNAKARTTVTSFVWIVPEPVRLDGGEFIRVTFPDQTKWIHPSVSALAVETDRFYFPVFLPLRNVNGQARLELFGFKDRAGNPVSSIDTQFKIDRGPYIQVKVFQNPIDPKRYGLVFKGVDYRGKDSLILYDPNQKKPSLKVSQAGLDYQELSVEALRVAQVGSSLYGLGFRSDFGVSQDYIGDMSFLFQIEDVSGISVEREVILHVTPLKKERISASFSRVAPSFLAILGRRDQAIDAISSENPGIFLGSLPWEHLNFGSSVSWRGEEKITTSCQNLVFIEFSSERRIPLQTFTCEQGSLAYALEDVKANQTFLIQDFVPPQIYFEKSGYSSGENWLKAEVIDSDSVVLNVDFHLGEKKVRGVYDPLEKNWKARFSLQGGEENLQILAKDAVGNLASLQKSIQVVGVFSLENCQVYPNPVRRDAWVDCRFSSPASELLFSLHDASGQRISKWEGTGLSKVKLPLSELSDRSLANGVYFIKIRADSGNKILKKTLKFAVLK